MNLHIVCLFLDSMREKKDYYLWEYVQKHICGLFSGQGAWDQTHPREKQSDCRGFPGNKRQRLLSAARWSAGSRSNLMGTDGHITEHYTWALGLIATVDFNGACVWASPSRSLGSMYPRTSDTPSSGLGQVPPWTRSQAGSARAVQSAVMDRAPGRADTRLRSGCLGNEVPPLLLRPPGTVEPGGAYILIRFPRPLLYSVAFPLLSVYLTALR